MKGGKIFEDTNTSWQCTSHRATPCPFCYEPQHGKSEWIQFCAVIAVIHRDISGLYSLNIYILKVAPLTTTWWADSQFHSIFPSLRGLGMQYNGEVCGFTMIQITLKYSGNGRNALIFLSWSIWLCWSGFILISNSQNIPITVELMATLKPFFGNHSVDMMAPLSQQA